MCKLYNGGASFGFSLNYNTAVPVDTRIVVKTITDLKDPQTWISGRYDAEHDENNVYTVYPGLAVAVTDEKTVYVFSNETVNGTTIADYVVALTAKIGEKLSLRRLEVVTKSDDATFGSYLHMGGKIAALTVVKGNNSEVAKDVAML